jgi:hypothetical protein
MANRIDEFYFVRFERTDGGGTVPELLFNATEKIQRNNVNGTGFIRQGVKGNTFEMLCGVDCPSRSAAETLRFLYLTIQGTQKVELEFNGIDYAAVHGVAYVVEQVHKPLIKRLTAAVGGLSSPSNYWLETTWVLTPVHA